MCSGSEGLSLEMKVHTDPEAAIRPVAPKRQAAGKQSSSKNIGSSAARAAVQELMAVSTKCRHCCAVKAQDSRETDARLK